MEWLREGGVWSWLQVLLGGCMFVASTTSLLVAFAAKKKTVALGVVGVAGLGFVLMLALAVIGWMSGNHNVDQALLHAAPEHQELMKAVGRQQARAPFWGLLWCGTVPFVVWLAALGRAATRQEGPAPGSVAG